ncbi:MAG: beta-galactosidase, partial [Muribaculaceae bacterium]|nr:beta-galactosidase [Muribaculaceae bacterium]
VAYNADGSVAEERTVNTAGRPAALRLEANRQKLQANGDDLVYFTVTVVDSKGNPVPTAGNTVKFEVSGSGTFEATANGDPTCLMPFQKPEMKLFSGAATVIARSATTPGTLKLRATARGLKAAEATVEVR